MPKRSAPKWTSNKMDNAKKGHNKTGHAKVVVQKRRASGLWVDSFYFINLSIVGVKDCLFF